MLNMCNVYKFIYTFVLYVRTGVYFYRITPPPGREKTSFFFINREKNENETQTQIF